MTSATADPIVLQLSKNEILRLVRVSMFPISKFSFNLLNKLSFRVLGYTRVGSVSVNSNTHVPLYLFKCPIHGLQVSTPSGWDSKLICRDCAKE